MSEEITNESQPVVAEEASVEAEVAPEQADTPSSDVFDAAAEAAPVEATVEGEEATEEVAEQASADATDDADDTPKSTWYAIHAYSGFEQKVLKNIQYRLDIEGLGHHVASVIVPTHTVIEIKDGKKNQTERNLMPGYVLIELTAEGDTFKEIVEEITALSGVAGFVGDGSNPIPLGDDEVDGLLSQTTRRQDKPKTEIQFTRGQVVKIIEGAFAGFTGSVDELDHQRGKLSVMVSIFGRPTAVELDVLQVDKG